MTESVNIHETKSHLSKLIARAEAGEEILIARANKPAVRLVPIAAPKPIRVLGEAKGLANIHGDIYELPQGIHGTFLVGLLLDTHTLSLAGDH